MSRRFEDAWASWQRLNQHERAKFLSLLQQWYAARDAVKVATRQHATPAPRSAFDELATVDALDFDGR